MERGLVNLTTLRNNKDRHDFRGRTAYCFLDKNKIIKIYANEEDDEYFSLDRHLIQDFSGLKSDIIVFPQEYLYENNQKEGEISRYIPDQCLLSDAITTKTRINLLISHYIKALNEIKKYTNLLMNDLDSVNILYSGKNGFHIIDVTEWNYSENQLEYNTNLFNRAVYETLRDVIELPHRIYDFLNSYMPYNILNGEIPYGKVGKEFYELMIANLSDDLHVLELLESYKTMYQIYYGSEVKTLGQVKKYTKILQKG